MKRSWIKRGTKQLKRSGFIQKPRKPLKRTRIRVVGHSTTSELKTDIQAVLRELAILTDGGCVLRHYPEAGKCGGFRNDGTLIYQAEHLVTRSNTISFADMRNIVCLCRHHHGDFKPQHSRLYWDLIHDYIGEERWKWLKKVEADKKAYKVDLKLALIVLKQDLLKLKATKTVDKWIEEVLTWPPSQAK